MLGFNGIYRSLRVGIDALIGTAFIFVGRFLPPLRPDVKNLHGKTAVVTGANSGVGYGIALQLAEMGAFVVLACRNEKKALQAKTSILASHPSASIAILSLDNASLSSVRAFARDWNYGEIDFLFHNAGISSCPSNTNFSEDGFEFIYQTNFLSSFLLTHLLEGRLSPTARVIFTSSIGSYAGIINDTFALARTQRKVELGFHSVPTFTPGDETVRYAQTKLMQAAFARALQLHFNRNLHHERIAYSFEPGLVKTNVFAQQLAPLWVDPVSWILATIMPYVGIELQQGSSTGVHLATSTRSDVLVHKGRYFDRMKVRNHKADIMSQLKLDRLWARWCADVEVTWT